MRVLLTGAGGFIGGYVLKSLLTHNIEVVTIGRQRIKPLKSAEFIETDLLTTQDFQKLIKKSKATHLIHLAWYTEHGKYWDSSLNLRWVEASIRLVEAFCKKGGQHVTVAGTCAEYDWSYGYCQEATTPLKPLKLYGIAKDTTRRLLKEICASHQVPCAWGRIFLPYGKGEASQRLIPSLIDVFMNKQAPFGINANAYRDFLHVSDVAEGFVSLLTNCADEVYNISSGEPIRLADIVKKIAMMFDADPNIVLDLTTGRSNEPHILVGDNFKLKSLGWNPSFSLQSGLKKTIS